MAGFPVVIIISDNSALSALAEIGYVDLLPGLFGRISIPEAVQRECSHPGAPALLRNWIAQNPDWLQVLPDPPALHPATALLGPGEAAAITLAWLHRGHSRLILDEKSGRRVAETLGLPKTGVLGLLADAAKMGILDFDDAIQRLRDAGFWMSEALIQAVRQNLS